MAKNKLSFINKLFFLLNNVFAIALIVSFFVPKLSPKEYGVFALLSLVTPALIVINVAFVIYWTLIGFKKQLTLSFFVLLLSYLFIPSVYKFYNSNPKSTKNSLSIMTYNVRKFNKYKWIKLKHIDSLISAFITVEKPDIVALQEFRDTKSFKLTYPYYYNPFVRKKNKSSLAIYSKYPIINNGLIKHNNRIRTIFIDVVKNNDTIRIYNFRLESLGVIPDEDYFGHKDSEKLIKRLRSSFKTQQKQIDTLNTHLALCEYKIILAGDMNNTAYSWAYKNMKNDLQDSFLEVGKGFGKTYKFKKFPLRIDYIFADESMRFTSHKTFNKKYSDHYPISATIEIE